MGLFAVAPSVIARAKALGLGSAGREWTVDQQPTISGVTRT